MAGIGFHLPGANGVGHEAEPKQDDMPDSSNSQTKSLKVRFIGHWYLSPIKTFGDKLVNVACFWDLRLVRVRKSLSCIIGLCEN